MNSNNLIEMNINSMMKGGVLSMKELSKKFLCFGVDGVNVFQGSKTKVTKQNKDLWASFSMGVHCVAHCINLVIQCLGDLALITKIEAFMLNVYAYFCQSLNMHLKF